MEPSINIKDRLSIEAIQILDAFQHAVVITDLEGNITFWNDGAQSLLGWSGEEAMDHEGVQWMLPQSHHEQAADIISDLARGISWKGDFPLRRSDGSTIWGEVIASPVFGASGAIHAIVASILDATSRHEAEEHARRLENHRRITAEISGMFTFEQNLVTGEILFADHLSAVTGLDMRSPTAEDEFYSHIHSADLEYVQKTITNAITPGGPGEYDIEYRYFRADGEMSWFSSRAKVQFTRDENGSHATYLNGVIADITHSKLLQQDLANRQERLRLAVEAANAFTYERDMRTNRVIFDDNVYRITGFPVGTRPYYETYYSRISPEDADALRASVARAMELDHPTTWKSEYRFRRYDGELRWFESNITTYFDNDSPKPTRLVGLVTDITDEKRTEDAQRFLSESSAALSSNLDYDETLERVVNNAVPAFADMAAVYLADPTGELSVVAVAHRDPEMEQLVRQVTHEFTIPETHILRRVEVSGEPVLISNVTEHDFTVLARSPEHRELASQLHQTSVIVVPLADHGGVLGVLTLAITDPERGHYDSTDLAVATELGRRCGVAVDNARLYTRMAENEKRLNLTLQISKVGFYQRGYPIGDSMFVSTQWAQIFGYETEELPGPSEIENWFYTQVHPDDIKSLMHAAAQSRKDPSQTFTVEMRVRHKEGHWVWVRAVNHVSARNEAGRITQGSGVMLDITDLKEAERTLQYYNDQLAASVAERTKELEELTDRLRAVAAELTETEQRERQRLAQMLHDDLQQLLLAARMQVNSINASDESHPLTRQTRDMAVHLLNQAIAESRTLTAQLRPPALYERGLAPALSWLTEWMEMGHGLKVDLEIDDSLEPVTNGDAALLFDAIRELLLNVVKHSGTDTASVSLRSADENRVNVTVSDQGHGFDTSAIDQSSSDRTGLGLASLTERIDLSGGELTVTSQPGHGTAVEILWPVTGSGGE